MKKPPSASVNPPIHTTHRVPMRFLETGRRCRQRRRHCDIFRRGGFGCGRCVRLGLRRQGRRFGRLFRRRRREGPLKLLQRRKRWRQRPCRGRRFERLHAPAQRCGLVERLERQDERDDGDYERQEEVERGIEHSVSSEHDCGKSLPRTRCGAGYRFSDENRAQNTTCHARPLTGHCRGPSQSIRCRLAP